MRITLVGCLVIAAVFCVSGCTGKSGNENANRASGPNTAASRANAQPERIISAAPSNTEIVIGLGLGDRLIAVDKYSGDIEGVPAGLPLIDFFYPDGEAIIGFEPDLILANEINTFGVADNPFKLLSDLGFNIALVPTSNSVEGIFSDILFVADVLGVAERGEALVNSMKEEIAALQAQSSGIQGFTRKRVYFEVSSMPTMVTFGRGAYLNEMIEIAGGINIFADQESWFSVSEEAIISRNPELIFTMAYQGEDPVREIMSRGTFAGVAAIRQNQVYVIDANSAARPSQHIILALKEMALAINQSSRSGQ